MLRLLDIAAIAREVRAANASRPTDKHILLVVDNTFATPALQRPIDLGADLVVHSTTKYLGGHSDVIGGAVIAADVSRLEPIRFYQNAAGAVPGPFDCFLTHRGIKTLHVRMARHCENALQIARWAAGRPEFVQVIYPGLESHPDHRLARQQMRAGGGIVTCVLAGGLEAAKHLLSRTKLFACAESLGGVESLISHPATMTHASVPPDRRQRIGIVDGLVRLSVGIEDWHDLIEDLEAALTLR
jgi:cystathionine gamma-lyase